MVTRRELNQYLEERIVTVQEVNMERMVVILRDQYGTTLYASMHLNDPQLSIPMTGERWTAKRQGIDWLLGRKLDTGNEMKPIIEMEPGDYRIEASNDLHLNGNEITMACNEPVQIGNDAQVSGIVAAEGFTLGNLPSASGEEDESGFSLSDLVLATIGVTSTSDVQHTLTASDSLLLASSTYGNMFVALPPAGSVTGRIYKIKKIVSNNTVTITAASDQKIDGVTSKVLTNIYSSYTLVSDGENWHILSHIIDNNGPGIIWNETPSGSVDGVNTIFTTANPFRSGQLMVMKNGLVLKPTTDYTTTLPNTITFAVAPAGGSTLLVTYVRQ